MALTPISVTGTSDNGYRPARRPGPVFREAEVNRRGSPGFTLLELLVVMFIVGIIAAMATLSVGVAASEKGIEKEIQRITDLLALASDEAVLQGREFGLTFYAREYEFSAYDAATGEWAQLDAASEPFTPRRFPPDTIADLEIEERLVRLNEERPEPPGEPGRVAAGTGRTQSVSGSRSNGPQVLILSSGDITPFGLRLRHGGGSRGITLRVAENGTIEQLRDEL